ncbi:MAG: leucine-rich repeat protein [Oscillospiraceae bacterium]
MKKLLACATAIMMLLSEALLFPQFGETAQTGILSASALTSGNFSYSILTGGNVSITGYTGTETQLSIPAAINGSAVTSIGTMAFYHNSTLTSVTIPDSVTVIDTFAFYTCTSLSEVTISNTAAQIGGGAFYGCSSLTSVAIPQSVTSIGDYAFGNCPALTQINVAADNAQYSSFDGALYNKSRTQLICCPAAKTSYTVPDGVTSLAHWAFGDCTSLSDVTIPDSVTSIGQYAFYNSLWLGSQPDGVVYAGKVAYTYKGTMPESTSVTLRSNTVGVAEIAFYNAAALTSVTIPSGVSVVGDYAFHGCDQMTSATILSDSVSIGASAFGYTYNQTEIMIPDFTIFCYAASAGEAYAQEKGFAYVTLVDLSALSAALTETTSTYDGTAKTPAVTIDGLTAGTDFTVAYENNTAAGTATVTVTGIGNYTGTITKTFAITAPPVAAPTKLSSSTVTASSVTLGWTAASGVSGYVLETKNAAGGWDQVKTLSGSATSCTVTGLIPGTAYSYRLRAYLNIADSTFYSTGATCSALTLPAKVSGLKATAVTTTGYTISWTAAKGADQYVIYRYDSASKKYVKLKTVTGTSYAVTGRTAGQKNTYRVVAVAKEGGLTQNAAPAAIKLTTKPAQVKNLKSAVSRSTVTLSWSKVTNATGYKIYYSTSKTGTYKLLKTITSGTTVKYSTASLTVGKTYYFKVGAVSATDNMTATGSLSAAVKQKVFNNKSFNTILSDYTNSKSVKTVNTQGYTISAANKKRLTNAMTSQGGAAGFLMYDLDSGAVVAYNANTYFGTASTAKLPYMLYALTQMEDGTPTMNTLVTLQAGDKHAGSGILQYAKNGTKHSLKEIFQNICNYSDNTAYYMLQRTFNYKGYNKYIASLGCKTSINGSSIRWGVVSAADSAREWIEMDKYLKTGKYRTMMKAELSDVIAGYFRQGLNNKYTVYSKSGWTKVYQNDTALIMAEHPYILICLTDRVSTARIQEVAKTAEAIHNEMWAYYD